MAKRFSFQLYSSRNHGPLSKTLAMLAAAGYAEVEGFGGVYDQPHKLRKLLDKHGLSMPTGHFGIDMLEADAKQVVGIARTLGMNTLVAPYLTPEQMPHSARGWEGLGKRLNNMARTYRDEGFGFAWHNHDFEFVPLQDGSVPLDLLFAAAPLVDWEIDVAWVQRSGAKPVQWIKRYGSRITAAHVKDIAPKGKNLAEDGWADVGSGVVKWADLMKALSQTRCMHWVMEHDNPSDAARFARRSITAARKL